MMEEQLEKKKAEIESVKTMKDKLDTLLGTLPTEIDAQSNSEVGPINGFKKNDDSVRQDQEATWTTLEEKLGT
jgi:mediator of RNA polymerase II transcription subunit 7